MFDPAASLMKTIGLALPVEAATVVAAQVPGESTDAAGNGGFAGLLALKLDSAEPAARVPFAPQAMTGPTVSLLTQPSQPSAPIDPAAKTMPATGNILPLALPQAAPTALAPAQIPARTLIQTPVHVTVQASVQAPTQAPAQPAAIFLAKAVTPSPVAAPKLPTPPVSDDSPAIPEAASNEAVPATPQLAPTATAPSRRLAPRAAANVAPVLTDASEAPEPALPALSPKAALHAALPAVAAKPRALAAHSVAPEQPEAAEVADAAANKAPAQGERNDLIKSVSEVALPAVPAPLDLVTPAPVASPSTLPAEPSAPAPAPAGSGKAPLAAAPALAPETAPPVLQADAAPAPAVTAQVRIAMRFPAEPGRQEGEAPKSAAPARRSEDSPLAAALPTNARFADAPAALPSMAPTPTHGHVTVQAPAAVEAPADFAQIVDRLVAARDAVAPAEVRVTLDHAQFGKVSVGFTPDASGMNVTLAAADPEFARAVEAAAPFAPTATSEAPQVTPPTSARGSDLPSAFTGQQGQQPGRQPQADPRPGTPQSNPSHRSTTNDAEDSRRRGIFA